MNLSDVLRTGWLGLKRNRVYSSFLLAGTTVGVIISTLVAGVGEGALGGLRGLNLGTMGETTLLAWAPGAGTRASLSVSAPPPASGSAPRGAESGSSPEAGASAGRPVITSRNVFILSDVGDIRSDMPGVLVSPLLSYQGSASVDGVRRTVPLLGVSEDILGLLPIEVRSGSFFTREEYAGGARVCTMGAELAQKLFAGQSPVGSLVSVGGVAWVVVGVTRQTPGRAIPPQAGLGYASYVDDGMLVPATALENLLAASHAEAPDSGAALLSGSSPAMLLGLHPEVADWSAGDVRDRIRALAATRWRFPERDLPRVTTLGKVVSSNARSSYAVLGGIWLASSLVLFVACLNIINFMIAQVNERRKELAVRKAMGATDGRLRLEIVIEAGAFGLVSSLGAVPFVLVLARLANEFFATMGADQTVVRVGWTTFTLMAVVACAVASLAGLVPAGRAARVPPAEFLRVER